MNIELDFEKNDFLEIHNHVVFLDVDGTIVSDGKDIVDQKIKNGVNILKQQNNIIYLCSNKKLHDRNLRIAESLGVLYLRTVFRKPSTRVLEGLPMQLREKKKIVIGDKVIIDGFFAWRIRAQFLKVRGITSPDDSLFPRILYAVDRLISKIMS